LVMLKYAVRHSGADWTRIRVADAGSPGQMAAAWVAGTGDYLHLQGPVPPAVKGEIVAAVGAGGPPGAFRSLCGARQFEETGAYREFLKLYGQAREWVRTAPPAAVAAAEAPFFPQVPGAALADAVGRYQALGCWDGGIEIPRE